MLGTGRSPIDSGSRSYGPSWTESETEVIIPTATASTLFTRSCTLSGGK